MCPTCEATGDRAHTQRYCPRFENCIFLCFSFFQKRETLKTKNTNKIIANIVIQGKRREAEVF